MRPTTWPLWISALDRPGITPLGSIWVQSQRWKAWGVSVRVPSPGRFEMYLTGPAENQRRQSTGGCWVSFLPPILRRLETTTKAAAMAGAESISLEKEGPD